MAKNESTVSYLAEKIGISRKNLYKKMKKYKDYRALVEIAVNCNRLKMMMEDKEASMDELFGNCNEDK